MSSGDDFGCFVRGLALATNERALENAFSQFGDIVDTKIFYDHETGQSKGYGLVTFKDEKSMNDAIAGMDGQELDGLIIIVNKAISSGSSVGGGGRGGGRRLRGVCRGGGPRGGGGRGGDGRGGDGRGGDRRGSI